MKRNSSEGAACTADSIPVAKTPPGGFQETFPPPVLAACTEPLVDGAPDLRGLWKVIRVERAGQVLPETHAMYSYVERIEQCGDRIVDMGGGTIADCRCDGTEANGVHDVSAFDFKTPNHAIASYEDGAFVLRPVNLPPALAEKFPDGIRVTRRLDENGYMVWTRPDAQQVVTLERVGDGAGCPVNTFAHKAYEPKPGKRAPIW